MFIELFISMLTEALAWLGLESTTFNPISLLVVLGIALALTRIERFAES